MDGPLFMAHQHVTDRRIHQHVIDFQHHTAGMAKDGIHPFLLETFDEDLCPAFLHCKLPPQTLHHRESVPVHSSGCLASAIGTTRWDFGEKRDNGS
jgi:hypothetical protein